MKNDSNLFQSAVAPEGGGGGASGLSHGDVPVMDEHYSEVTGVQKAHKKKASAI